MSKRKNEFPEMLTEEDLQNFGFTRSMAYVFLNFKNADLIKSVGRLTDEITEKSKIIAKLQSEAVEQLNQKSRKLFGKS